MHPRNKRVSVSFPVLTEEPKVLFLSAQGLAEAVAQLPGKTRSEEQKLSDDAAKTLSLNGSKTGFLQMLLDGSSEIPSPGEDVVPGNSIQFYRNFKIFSAAYSRLYSLYSQISSHEYK
jgi:hypothetical protein